MGIYNISCVDAPALKAPYEERVAFIKKHVVPRGSAEGDAASGCPYAAPVGIIICKGRDHLNIELSHVDKKGGEGLMLRKPGSAYENRRSNVLLKVKSVHDEEAKVIGHEGGRGAIAFHCGALTLETPDGRRFSCGSGLSAADRKKPPAIGTVVTFRFTELMDNGYPRFPVYIGPRIDLDWAAVCRDYKPPSADDHKSGGLKRVHSIMYAETSLARTLTARADSLQEAGDVTAGEPWASEASEGGDTEADSDGCAKSGGKKLRGAKAAALRSRRQTAEKAASAAETRARLWKGASSMALRTAAPEASGAAGSVRRTRSQNLADETGLDLATARSLLSEHDRAATAS